MHDWKKCGYIIKDKIVFSSAKLYDIFNHDFSKLKKKKLKRKLKKKKNKKKTRQKKKNKYVELD